MAIRKPKGTKVREQAAANAKAPVADAEAVVHERTATPAAEPTPGDLPTGQRSHLR